MVFYDFIHSMQEDLFTHPLKTVLDLVQLNLNGTVDPDITFEFEPLKELDGEALARVQKSAGDAAVAYISAGVLTPDEERARLAGDPDSGYTTLDLNVTPDPPEVQISDPEEDGATSGPD